MSLFDSLAGQVLGALSGNTEHHGGLLDAIGGLLNNPQTGGLSGLVTAFEQNGLGGVVASWIGTGQNLPISAEQIQAVLGSSQLASIAQKLGISTDDVASHLSNLLPQVVDKLTPQGELPHQDALSGLLGALRGAAS